MQKELFEQDLEKVGMSELKPLTVDGFTALIRRTPMGHLCGYVEVPEGLSVDVDSIICHGGITFDQAGVDGFPTSGYYIGFDCGHAGDWTPWSKDGIYRDSGYVFEEIKGLVQQLKERE